MAVSTPSDIDKAAYYINKAAVDKARFTTSEYGVLEQTAKDIHSLTLPKPSKFSLLDRFYFWFFNLRFSKSGETKIFGAGLLSSLSELEKIQNEVIDKKHLFQTTPTMKSLTSKKYISLEKNLVITSACSRKFKT